MTQLKCISVGSVAKLPFALSLSKGLSFFKEVKSFDRLSSNGSRRRFRNLLAAAFAAVALLTTPAHAERIKDLGTFQGVRPNQLTGYGIVVGLAGTGDDSLDYATQGVKGMFRALA